MKFAGNWLELEKTTLREVTLIQKGKHCMFSYQRLLPPKPGVTAENLLTTGTTHSRIVPPTSIIHQENAHRLSHKLIWQ